MSVSYKDIYDMWNQYNAQIRDVLACLTKVIMEKVSVNLSEISGLLVGKESDAIAACFQILLDKNMVTKEELIGELVSAIKYRQEVDAQKKTK